MESVMTGRGEFAGSDGKLEEVLSRRERAGRKRSESTGRCVGAVEIDYHLAVGIWLLDIEKSSWRVGGFACGLVMEHDEVIVVVGLTGHFESMLHAIPCEDDRTRGRVILCPVDDLRNSQSSRERKRLEMSSDPP